MSAFLLILDEGTTSTRAMLFDACGDCHGSASLAIDPHYPAPGHVEHDAAQIWERTLRVGRTMVERAGGPDRIAAIGIANQRETTVFWSKATGEPLAPAIVWQDRRTAAMCRTLRERGEEAGVQARTGLLLDPYFSATKIAWALEHWPRVADAGADLAIGTVESWLVWKLTGGEHLTDASNASRTLLMGLGSGQWDDGLIDLFGVPRGALPRITDNAGHFGSTTVFGGTIPICGLAGDQQAATIGQACLERGAVKATLGTGAFILANCGAVPPTSHHRLLATVGWQMAGTRTYALEGSIFVAGSLMQWLRDTLRLIDDVADSAELARSVPDNGGVYCVPALAGIGAPWWQAEARGAITGLGFTTGRAHVVRACLEAMAHQCHDLQTAFAADGAPWATLRIDGGMVANDWLAQDLADLLALPVERPLLTETTALGAAMLAGIGCGWFGTLADAATAMRGTTRRFVPALGDAARERRITGWAAALQATLASHR